jgi:hypothetical protein
MAPVPARQGHLALGRGVAPGHPGGHVHPLLPGAAAAGRAGGGGPAGAGRTLAGGVGDRRRPPRRRAAGRGPGRPPWARTWPDRSASTSATRPGSPRPPRFPSAGNRSARRCFPSSRPTWRSARSDRPAPSSRSAPGTGHRLGGWVGSPTGFCSTGSPRQPSRTSRTGSARPSRPRWRRRRRRPPRWPPSRATAPPAPSRLSG